ncbi:OmpA family protein [candidate division TA06 bacterium]|nr:OmpA family protein [candidate division TA06 bacterium]
MKRIFAMFAVVALMAGMAMAQPSIYGSKGLIWTIDPGNAGPMNYGVGVNGAVMMSDSTLFTYKSMSITVLPGIYFSISDMFELSVAPAYQMTTTTVAGTDYKNNGLLDTRVGVKYSQKFSDLFCLGVYAGYDVPTLADTFKFGATGSAYKYTGVVHGVLIPGFNFGAANLNLNVGVDYSLNKVPDGATVDTTDSKAVYPNMVIPYGLGFSYKVNDMFTPFVEASGSYAMDTNKYGTDAKTRGFMNYDMFVTPGLRMSFPMGLHITAGFSYNLIDTVKGIAAKPYPWIGHFGLAYAPVKTAGPKVAPTASISGKVTDAKGKGLAATITAGGLTANTDPATGVYTLAGLPITKAPVEIKADAKLYIAKSASVILTKKNKKTPAVQDFALELKPIPMGAAKGMVKDAAGPVEATIAFAGPKAETAKAVAGAYNVNLQTGNYTATVTAAGYFDKTATIAITEKGTAMTDFAMLKKGAVVPVEVVWTAANKAMVKTVNVEALVKMIQDNPKAKVVITAYVDRVGGKKMNQTLATQRADAVRAELVKVDGKIDVARITTVGQLVVPAGKTNAARALNTKVEVSFVE